jgi:hypothetical protein
LNASTGGELWNFSTSDKVTSSPALAEGKVYVGSHDGYLYCIAINGTPLWNYSLGGIVSSSPAVINMRAYGASENGTIVCFRDHNPPITPGKPTGPTEGVAGKVYPFESATSDPEQDPIYYRFDWGDGNQSNWLGPFEQHNVVTVNYSWEGGGYYNVTVKAKDSYGYESAWSQPLTIHINILDISYVRGGFGIHVGVTNLGLRKLWHVHWNISIVGGYIRNPATGMTAGEILSLASGATEMVATGPFFELGRIEITVTVRDSAGENVVTRDLVGFAFGYLVLLFPWT